MENKKTIEYLNTKGWYRFLKVIYIICLLFYVIGSPIAIFFNYSPTFDNTTSYFQCANGKKFILSDNGFNLYSSYMSDGNEASAKYLCFDGVREFKMEKIGNLGEYRVPVVISQTENSGKYELVSKFTNRNWIATVGFSLLSISMALLVFELVRRIFYYIVLGKIKPEK